VGADSSQISAIIVAAGRGSRFGGPKHEMTLAERPLWRHGFELLSAFGFHVVVVGDVPGGVPGGERRRDSVESGLGEISTEWVLVHDAARPLASSELVASVVARLGEGDVDGVIPVLPMTDTVKRVDGDRVVGTVDRSQLVTVQTPQGFRTETLRAAHRLDPADDITDDAGLVERLGGTVATVPGDPRNLKITYREDLERARLLLEGGPESD
jgi:2-C-methyl-D-erythritol 4-phosphate cytidylyltransferase